MTAKTQQSLATALYKLIRARDALDAVMDALQPLVSLLLCLYVGPAFFASGHTKLRDCDITLALLSEDYQVQLLSPNPAVFGNDWWAPDRLLKGKNG